jgi:hypothetical protein
MQPFGNATGVHLRVKASLPEDPVTSAGEMLFLPGRHDRGIWNCTGELRRGLATRGKAKRRLRFNVTSRDKRKVL